MPNNLATLNNKLAAALGDESYETWGTSEMDDLLKWSVGTLWPRFSRPLDPTATTVALVDGTEYYSLPAGVMNVSRCDLLNASSEYVGPVFGGAWEITGDVYAGTAKLHVSPQIPSSGGTLQLVGYGRYDTTANYIPDDFVLLVLAKARAEAYRRIAADRQRFKNWLARNQSQNVTVNELLLMINEADREAFRQEQHNRVWQKPMQGRVG